MVSDLVDNEEFIMIADYPDELKDILSNQLLGILPKFMDANARINGDTERKNIEASDSFEDDIWD